MPTEQQAKRMCCPLQQGWQFIRSFFDCDDAEWFAEWKRPTDPDRLGTCGMISKIPSGVENALEAIAEELSEMQSFLQLKASR